MKKFILCFTLLALTLGLQLQVDPRLVLEDSYQLHCANAQGSVTYQVQNLPSGVILKGNQIQISPQGQAVDGYYPVRVRAQDITGQSDERVIVIVVRRAMQQQQQKQSNIQNQITQASSQTQVNTQFTLQTPDFEIGSLLD